MKNKLNGITRKSLALASLGVFVLSSCTKSIPFKQLSPDAKEQTYSKSLIDTNSEYLYSASMQNASKSSSDALPYSSGDNKRVKLEIAENSIRIIETERDARYSPNAANNKLILEVPVEHVQFQCAKDKYGECTNTEENATDIPWNQRSDLKIKLEDAKSGELDLLPIMVSQTVGENCYDTVSTKLKSSDITAEAINFQVERTFKTRLECLGDVDSLSDATVTAVYHYSLVKVSSILSKDFKTISYPEGSTDEGTFGFFSSKRTILDVDNNKTNKSSVQIMNHWNPNRSEINYFLSDEFAKPENKVIKDLTYKTVDNINNGLAEAGVKFKIKLNEPAGKIPGDIRNSMIVLVEDPVESNIIGYGPQTEDPVTGEIISARTVMFLGTIKKFIRYTYDEILREKKTTASLNANSDKTVAATPSLHLSDELKAKITSLKNSGRTAGLSNLVEQVTNSVKAGGAAKASGANKAGTGLNTVTPISLSVNKIAQMQKTLKNYTANVNPEIVGTDLKSQLKYLNEAKNCAYAPAMESFSGGVSEKLMSQFSDDAKPWEQLSDSEKNDVIAIILPEIWIPTLIHEMGHNLGLRHNFAASEDKDNYYSADELKAKNVDHQVPFSSVMDYGDDLRSSPVLGKYDIAALRFGYLRQAEIKQANGSIAMQPVTESLEAMKSVNGGNLEVKDYKFCTDEHLGINAGCKQFDLGSSYTEIAQNLIKDYEDSYTKRNFRHGRANMSLTDDLTYASRISSIFRELRVMMEVKERIKYRYGLADDAKEWDEIEFLKDLKQATLISGAHLASVLLVPDATCAFALKDKPNEVIAVVNLNSVDQEALSCFDLKLSEKFVVVGQAGKMFNSKKDPNSTNNYMDQIDVRGIWLDKLVAARYLLNRQIGVYSMDKNVDNFLDVSELRDSSVNAIKSLMMNTVVDTVPFTLADGSKANLEINYDLFETQQIEKPMIPFIAKRMGVSDTRATQLQEVIGLGFAKSMIDDSGAHEEDRPLALSMIVNKYVVSETAIDKKAKQVISGDVRFVADATNALASEVIDNIAVASTLEKLDPSKIVEIAKARTAKQQMPKNATADEKAAWRLPLTDLQAYVDGAIKSTDFYNRLLSVLPIAQH